ncbi:MAG: extracellular solute-binding protein, partial [Thermomicrobiales bacterium]
MSSTMTRRRLLQATPAAVASLTIPAAASAHTGYGRTPSALTRRQEAREIVFWGHIFDPAVEMYKTAIEQFTQQYPEISVDYQQKPGADYPQLLLTAFAANDAPDVFRVGDWNIARYVADGLLAPLSTLYQEATGEDLTAQFVPGVLDKFTFDGVVYAIPEDLTVLLNVANMDYLQESGISEFPTTVDEFIAAGQATARQDGGRWVRSGHEWRYNHETWDTIQFSHLVRSYGGSIYTDNGETLALDSSEALAALQFYYDTIYSLEISDPAFGADPNHQFQNGDAAMMSFGPWGIPLIHTADVVTNWQAGPWATGPEPTTLAYSNNLVVNARSDAAVEAALYVGFLASRPLAELRTEQAGFLTGHRDTADFAYVKDTPGLDTWVTSVTNASFMDAFPDYAKVSSALSQMLQSIAFGQTEPRDALETT